MEKSLGLYRFYIVALVLLNIGCDQISKEVVRKNVPDKEYIQLINDYFILTNVENTGAMLGFGADFTPTVKLILLQGLPLLILLILLYRTLTNINPNKWAIIAFSLVIGGGIGNLIDRIAYGSVTDFFQVKMGIFKTGIFNMADVAVTIGILLILGLSLGNKKIAI